ncbi:MAG TPA: cyclodeaminase/cyclohydrolase family protein [Chloroflexota bacterium]|jgi:formiminotetrahydrofolate cyclodeaminase|nr:cyclodeaminase/cyclohydrolase family protein [Chloroflexota bacterium]
MPELNDLSLTDFSEELASGNPTPGGGAAAALAGALGAALLAMVCRFTVGRERFAAVENDVQAMLAEADAARGRFHQAVEADAEAYAGVGAAYRLPRATDEEKASRSAAIAAASWAAAQPPLAVAEEAASLVILCHRAADITNPMLGSDVTTAIALVRAAIDGGAANVEANMSGVSPEQAAELRQRLDAARERGSR